MFHLDTTFEDTRIIASSKDGFYYGTKIIDNLTGENQDATVTGPELAAILAYNLYPDGEPVINPDMQKQLDHIFKDWPNNLRPIP